MQIETVTVTTLDGLDLRGDLALPPAPRAAAVVAHPHPLYGGDRFNPVVDVLFRSLAEAGCAALRLDFRGVNESEGAHGGGEAERLDVAAGLDLLARALPDQPLLAAGYSFGAVVVLQVVDPRLDGWLAVAPPLAAGSGEPLAALDHRPKLVLVPEHDQFGPPASVEARTAGWRSTTVEVIPAADHFLAGAGHRVAAAATRMIADLAPTPGGP